MDSAFTQTVMTECHRAHWQAPLQPGAPLPGGGVPLVAMAPANVLLALVLRTEPGRELAIKKEVRKPAPLAF